jgi:hypothetical protein
MVEAMVETSQDFAKSNHPTIPYQEDQSTSSPPAEVLP